MNNLEWVALATGAVLDDQVYCDGAWLMATDGERMHWSRQFDRAAGWYDPVTGDATNAEWWRLMQFDHVRAQYPGTSDGPLTPQRERGDYVQLAGRWYRRDHIDDLGEVRASYVFPDGTLRASTQHGEALVMPLVEIVDEPVN